MGKIKQLLKQAETQSSDYDSAWKDVVERHLEEFLEFFFPEVYAAIDFSKGYQFLKKDFRKLSPDATIGNRFADEVVKVYLKGSGKVIALFIHIEIQGQQVEDFSQKVFIYFYRIYDELAKEGYEVISLALLTDESRKYRPDTFTIDRCGFELRMKIPLIKVIDFKDKPELALKLANSKSIMAMVAKAQLMSYEARKADDLKKFNIKRELIYQCFRGGFKKDDITTLLRFLDYIFRLPRKLEEKIRTEIKKLVEENKMPYITSWERMAKEEGEKKGKREVRFTLAKEMLRDNLPIETILKYTKLTAKQLASLSKPVTPATH